MVDKGQTRVTPELWWKVYDRDHRKCIAPQLDDTVDPSSCRGKWQNPVQLVRNATRYPYDLTFAHIKEEPGGARIHDEAHGVIVCWGHHVFGDMWATSDRGLELIRAYLRSLYPAVWQ